MTTKSCPNYKTETPPKSFGNLRPTPDLNEAGSLATRTRPHRGTRLTARRSTGGDRRSAPRGVRRPAGSVTAVYAERTVRSDGCASSAEAYDRAVVGAGTAVVG